MWTVPGTYRTFFRIVVPMAKSIFVVIFSLSFAWQWTDTFYSNLLMGEVKLLPNVIAIMNAVSIGNKEMYYTMVKANAATIPGAAAAAAVLLPAAAQDHSGHRAKRPGWLTK